MAAVLALMLLIAGCDSNAQRGITPTGTAFASTFTLPASPATALLKTPIPLSPQPTIVVAEGITSTQVNVRVEPSTASYVLGVIPADMRVEITGKDPGGNLARKKRVGSDAADLHIPHDHGRSGTTH